MTDDTPHPSPNSVPAIKIRCRKSTGSWVSAEAGATPQPGPDAEGEALKWAEIYAEKLSEPMPPFARFRICCAVINLHARAEHAETETHLAIVQRGLAAKQALGYLAERDAAQAEVKRLREALERIFALGDDGYKPNLKNPVSMRGITSGGHTACREIARAALSAEPQAADAGERG